jgi:hypothetical protein
MQNVMIWDLAFEFFLNCPWHNGMVRNKCTYLFITRKIFFSLYNYATVLLNF